MAKPIPEGVGYVDSENAADQCGISESTVFRHRTRYINLGTHCRRYDLRDIKPGFFGLPDDTILDSIDAAKFLNIGESTLRKRHADKRGPKIVPMGASRLVRYTVRELHRWMDEHAVEHVAAMECVGAG